MKRVFSLVILVLVLCFNLCFAFADGEVTENETSNLESETLIEQSADESSDPEGNSVDSEGEEESLNVDTLVVTANTVELRSVGDPEEALPDEPSSIVDDIGYYMNVTYRGSDIRMYVPREYIDNYFSVDDNGYLYFVGSSTFTTYLNGEYVRFQSFAQPEFRSGGSGYNYTYTGTNITFNDSPNVSVLGANLMWWSHSGYALLIIGLIGVVIICLFIKR